MSDKMVEKGKGKKKSPWTLRIIFIIGFLLCCYPLASGIIERQYQKDAVATYKSAMENTSEEDKKAELEKAREYNSMLYQSNGAIVDNLDMGILSDESYNSLLSNGGSGVMGSIEIPKIDVDLPIYHGTDDSVLSNGVGHLEGTSLPVGGESTRCVLTGHRGLPNSKLFTRLDEVNKGDLFFISVCGETLAYKVCEIKVVEPEEVGELDIVADKDLCTLVTCTPYGLNTHRLLVTGERVPYEKADYDSIDSTLPSGRELIFAVLPFIFIAIVVISNIRDRRVKKDGKKEVSEK